MKSVRAEAYYTLGMRENRGGCELWYYLKTPQTALVQGF